jgi:hypothetical protein
MSLAILVPRVQQVRLAGCLAGLRTTLFFRKRAPRGKATLPVTRIFINKINNLTISLQTPLLL